jgi:hypothetical protein
VWAVDRIDEDARRVPLPGNGSIAVRGGFPPEDRPDEADLAATK